MTVFESFPSTLIVFTCFLNFLSLEYCIVYPLTPFWVVHFKLISLERLILADVILACFGKIGSILYLGVRYSSFFIFCDISTKK